MKKLFVTLLFAGFISFIPSSLHLSITSNLSAQIPADGLVAWYPFNGNANDESGNGNDGNVIGATLSEDRFGNINSAYNFNVNNWTWGSNGDEIYIPYSPTFNTSEFSISVWVKRASDGAMISPQSLSVVRRYEFGYNYPNGETWVLDLAHGSSSNGSFVSGTVIQQSPSPAINFSASTTQTAPLNEWIYITMTYSMNTISIYLNGSLSSSAQNNDVVINTVGNSGISIGISDQANGHWAPFSGLIDDFAFYNRALSPPKSNNSTKTKPGNYNQH